MPNWVENKTVFYGSAKTIRALEKSIIKDGEFTFNILKPCPLELQTPYDQDRHKIVACITAYLESAKSEKGVLEKKLFDAGYEMIKELREKISDYNCESVIVEIREEIKTSKELYEGYIGDYETCIKILGEGGSKEDVDQYLIKKYNFTNYAYFNGKPYELLTQKNRKKFVLLLANNVLNFNRYTSQQMVNFCVSYYGENWHQREIGPKDFGKILFEAKTKYGGFCWYDWCVDNWGTKWEPQECNGSVLEKADFKELPPDIQETLSKKLSEEEINDFSKLTIYYQTAWSTPGEFLKTLTDLFPSVYVVHEYADEDLGNNTDRWSIFNRDVVYGFTAGMSERELFDFACSVWDYDADEMWAEYREDDEDEDE